MGSVLLACSSNEPEPAAWPPSAGGADAEAGGGAAGESSSPAEGGDAPAASCTSDVDCDDGQACNGVEACTAGSCVAGEPIECAEHLACVEADGGSCVFTDESPWVIYTADDDTVAQTEIYAVKRDLIGKMTPIKLNGELEAGSEVERYSWSLDRRLLALSIWNGEQYTKTEFVYCGAGEPRQVATTSGGSVDWSSSAHQVAVCSPSGVILLDYAEDGQLSPVFSWEGPTESYPHGAWSKSNDFVFGAKVAAANVSRLYTTSHDSGKWEVRQLTEVVGLGQLRVSPSEPELLYSLVTPDSIDSPLYALGTAMGSEPKLLAAEANSSVQWSQDGRQYLLLLGQQTEVRKVLLGEGGVLAGRTTQLAPTNSIRWASFAPDGRQILMYQPLPGWGQDVDVLDPTVRTDTAIRSITRMGTRDYLTSSTGTDFVVGPYRDADTTRPNLRLFPLKGNSSQLDEASDGEQIYSPTVSPHGYFVSYLKGIVGNYQGYYVDLRYGALWGYKPMRLPGEGRVLTSSFDAAGTSLYYILERENGARECWYLDLSGQVAAEPRKVSREGRARFCEAFL